MDGRTTLLTLANIFGHALGLPRTTVSWRLFEDTNKLDAIASGKDLYLGRYERALQYLSENWPAGCAWPDGIARPIPVARVEAAE
jgi:hypothetical protein